jgi:hypothetical protein
VGGITIACGDATTLPQTTLGPLDEYLVNAGVELFDFPLSTVYSIYIHGPWPIKIHSSVIKLHANSIKIPSTVIQLHSKSIQTSINNPFKLH